MLFFEWFVFLRLFLFLFFIFWMRAYVIISIYHIIQISYHFNITRMLPSYIYASSFFFVHLYTFNHSFLLISLVFLTNIFNITYQFIPSSCLLIWFLFCCCCCCSIFISYSFYVLVIFTKFIFVFMKIFLSFIFVYLFLVHIQSYTHNTTHKPK